MAGPALAVVIPCHNEAATLGPVAAGAAAFGEVFVVDDRSTDASAEIARSAGARVTPSAARGYDGALTTGLRAAFEAGYGRVVTMDADGEHDPATLARFQALFDAGAPLVCGYRPRPQRTAEYLVDAAAAGLFGVRDILCGMKGYSRAVLARHFDSGLPLHVNTAPAIAWRRAKGPFAQTLVTGTPRTDAPRFGRALGANLAILKAFAAVLADTAAAPNLHAPLEPR